MDIISIIAKTLRISDEQVTDDLSYQSIPEWDSLNHVSLMLVLEKDLGTIIDDNLLLKLTSVVAIKKYAQELLITNVERDIAAKSNIEEQSPAVEMPSVYRGLNNIIFDNTTITHMDGKMGVLQYRGYSIHDLVTFSQYEEVAYLLLYKELPTPSQLEDFNRQLKLSRDLPKPVVDLICSMSDAEPITVLRTVISMLASYDEDKLDRTYAGTKRKGIRLLAQLPTIVAMHHRSHNGKPFVTPNSSLSFAANILYMLNGEEPTIEQERIVNRNLILHADHSSNASTFAARVVTGTQADIHGAITAAIAAFSGPLHGGAIEQTMKMLREIGDPSLAFDYVQARRERQEPIMGFGHRVYRTEDPRAKYLRQSVMDLSHELQETKWTAILDEVVAAMQPYSRHGVHVNVDFYACVIYYLLGLSDELFVSMFVLGRISGWVAHVLEQWENNILIRPVMHYVGQKSRPFVPGTSRNSMGGVMV